MRHLQSTGVTVRDELEPLGELPGHWIADPAGNVLLVARRGARTKLDS